MLQQPKAGTGHCFWPASPALPPALGEQFTAAPRDRQRQRALGPVVWGPWVAFIQLPGGRGPWAALTAEETMERKALISAVMDTLLLKGGADGRNWGLGALFVGYFFAFILC